MAAHVAQSCAQVVPQVGADDAALHGGELNVRERIQDRGKGDRVDGKTPAGAGRCVHHAREWRTDHTARIEDSRVRATALLRSSRGTREGSIDCRAGESKAITIPLTNAKR